MTKEKILFYGINFYPELISTGKYTTEMAHWFADNNFDVRVVTAPPYYPDWKVFEDYSAWTYSQENIVGCKVYRCPLYVPKKLSALKRIIHLSSFALSSIPVLLGQIFWRPKAIVLIVPTILCLPVAIIVSKLCGAKLILHVQDFELDAMLGLDMVSSDIGFLKKIAYGCESWLMRRCDFITTIAESLRAKLFDKKVLAQNTALIPNWSDLKRSNSSMVENGYRINWDISPDSIVVLYSGNIGLKQGLETIVHAADYFRSATNIVFLIVGEGANKENLSSMVAEKNLRNLRFYDLQPTEKLPELLAMADIHLVLQKKGAADNVFPSKLTNILSVGGNALITADEDTELGKLVYTREGIAQLSEPENLEDFISKLNIMINKIDVGNRKINKIAHQYAEQNLDKNAILGRLKDILVS